LRARLRIERPGYDMLRFGCFTSSTIHTEFSLFRLTHLSVLYSGSPERRFLLNPRFAHRTTLFHPATVHCDSIQRPDIRRGFHIFMRAAQHALVNVGERHFPSNQPTCSLPSSALASQSLPPLSAAPQFPGSTGGCGSVADEAISQPFWVGSERVGVGSRAGLQWQRGRLLSMTVPGCRRTQKRAQVTWGPTLFSRFVGLRFTVLQRGELLKKVPLAVFRQDHQVRSRHVPIGLTETLSPGLQRPLEALDRCLIFCEPVLDMAWRTL
jgi:hypothetical protein